MDFRLKLLYEAAHAGDVYSLKELLEEDKLLLDRAVTTIEVNDNPLHIAATLGHSDFAREILRRKPKFAREFNRQHMSPLHLAAAQGHLAVAEDLLQVDTELGYLQDKDGYLPVHIAVIKGRHDLVTLLVGNCEDSVNVPTWFAETLLHLAVKEKHSEIVELLTARDVTHLVLNSKDYYGNTILHLAIAGRQVKVIKHLLSQADIDVNPVNSAGLTPLDVLLVTNHEMGDLYLGEMLRAAGGKTGKELTTAFETILTSNNMNSSNNMHNTSEPILLSTLSNQLTRTRSNTEETYKNIEKNLVVVATLVATITFGAALNPPGGSIQMSYGDSERKDPNWFRNWKHMDTLYPVGSPVYLWHLRKFFMYDYFALFASVSVILLSLILVIPSIPEVIRRSNTMRNFLLLVLWSSMFSMVVAFNSALSILLYKHRLIGRQFQWFTWFFKVWIFVFALVSLFLVYHLIHSFIYEVKGNDKKGPRTSRRSNLCAPKGVGGIIRWTFSLLFMTAIGFLVGWGIGFEIYDLLN